MSVYVRYCKKCGEAYDIGINLDLCLKCRGLIKKEGEEDDRQEVH